jgi:hypothetical protein
MYDGRRLYLHCEERDGLSVLEKFEGNPVARRE